MRSLRSTEWSKVEGRLNNLLRNAKEALRKRAPYGPDIDLEEFNFEEEGDVENETIESLPPDLRKAGEAVGIDVNERRVSGTYLQIDGRVLRSTVLKWLRERGLIVAPISEALRKFNWLKDYYWSAIPVDQDKYTAAAEVFRQHGYFIYVPPNVKIEIPVQTCLLTSCHRGAQAVHNIIIADENSELNLITGCATTANRGLHIGVSEFFVKRGARVTFTMIHGWAPEFHVRPRAAVVVEEGGTFVNYYINMHSVKSLQMLPTVIEHRNACSYLTTIVLGRGSAFMDVGGRIIFRGENARGEITSRSVIRDSAKVIMRGQLIAEAQKVRGHLECRGLLLSDSAEAEAIPSLKSKFNDVELTHEAALGRISEEEMIYLMMKGFNEDEATALLVRGFIDAGLQHLPESLRFAAISTLEMAARMAKG